MVTSLTWEICKRDLRRECAEECARRPPVVPGQEGSPSGVGSLLGG